VSDRGRAPAKQPELGARPAKPDQSIPLDAIESVSREALIEVWVKAYGRSPPKGISRRLLEYAAAYQAQSRARGGLNATIKRRLILAASHQSEPAPGRIDKSRRATLPSGSRLIREWGGRVHTVDVTESGFRYQNRQYGSLSEVARAITGVRWSGPRFFGT
jgi:hypothetical protein